MSHRVFSAIPLGMDSVKVEIEAIGTQGTPAFVLIGLPSRAVDESRERVTSALLQNGVRIRSKRTVVNLAPANLKKTTNALDLGIAIALLKMYGECSVETDDILFLGELSLSGEIRPVAGALSLALAAKKMGFSSVIFPKANSDEVSLLSGIQLLPVSHIQDCISFCKGKKKLNCVETKQIAQFEKAKKSMATSSNFSSIIGQHEAKRALEIAIAGGHHVMLTGPPGIGKTLLAKASCDLMSPLSKKEMIEVSHMYSLAGLFKKDLLFQRPFRAPHHSISKVALIGGSLLKPGEISLANHGVLFLDEFSEFSRDCREALRQPMEEKSITISRAEGQFSFPASCMIVIASNPCPCGYRDSETTSCGCSASQLQSYASKLSGPIIDRVDIQVSVKTVSVEDIQDGLTRHQLQSAQNALLKTKKRIELARTIQYQRFRSTLQTNAVISSKEVNKYCIVSDEIKEILKKASSSLSLSPRGYFKVLKIARTIADLDASKEINSAHIFEALNYRSAR